MRYTTSSTVPLVVAVTLTSLKLSDLSLRAIRAGILTPVCESSTPGAALSSVVTVTPSASAVMLTVIITGSLIATSPAEPCDNVLKEI